jgi:hypothetical protein
MQSKDNMFLEEREVAIVAGLADGRFAVEASFIDSKKEAYFFAFLFSDEHIVH